MKQVLHAMVLCLGLLLWSVVTTAAQQGTGLTAPKAYYQLRVDGLACPFCAYGIEKQLHAIKGVQEVVTDIKTGRVFVATAKGAAFDQATAKQAVADAGFRLKAFQAVERLPSNIENQAARWQRWVPPTRWASMIARAARLVSRHRAGDDPSDGTRSRAWRGVHAPLIHGS